MKQKIIIIGLGLSGIAAARLALAKDYTVAAYDDNLKRLLENDTLKNLFSKIELIKDLDSFSLVKENEIVVSPGIDLREPRFSRFLENKIYSEVEFACKWLQGPKIAVTGTNGKSTTVALISHILNGEEINSIACGNYGKPLSEIILEKKYDDYVKIVELSSYQLERMENVYFDVSACLAITEDHLNRYNDFSDYVNAKLNLFRNGNHAGHYILDNDVLGEIDNLEQSKITKIKELQSSGEINLFWDGEKICGDLNIGCQSLALHYEHNISNVLYALCAVTSLYPDIVNLQKSLQTFKPLMFRLQSVAKTNDGIEIINDSKSTSSDSTVKAIQSFKKPLILIFGGRHKKSSYQDLKRKIKQSDVKVIIYGESREFFAHLLSDYNELRQVKNLSQAVDIAFGWVEKEKTILFSPACESFDQFLNYKERGAVFNQLINKKINNN